jgi:hypothetical protein
MARPRHAGRPTRADVQALAAAGLRMPIGTDLVLRERADAGAIVEDGCRLDLQLEKADLLRRIRPDARPHPTPGQPDRSGGDVLHGPGSEDSIRRKLEAMLTEAA